MRTVPLKRLAALRSGGTPSVQEEAYWSDDGTPWVTIGDMTAAPIVDRTARQVTAAGRAAARLVVGPPGTLLFAMYASVGALAVLGRAAAWNQAILGIAPRTGVADARFIRYALSSLKPNLIALTRSNTQDNLNADQVGNLPVPVLSIERQRTIADFLDAETARIGGLVARQDQLLDVLRERLATSAETLLFPLPKMLDQSAKPQLPDGWTTRPLRSLLREVVDLSPDGGGELLSVSHLTGVTRRSQKNVTMTMAESLVGYKQVQPEDLVVNTLWAWMGAAGVSNLHGIVSPAYGVYRPSSSDLLPGYLDLLVRSRPFVELMTRYSKGVWTSRLRLYADELLGLRAPLPPVRTQHSIKHAVDRETARLRRAEALIETSNALLAERRQALITAAVTGQLGVAREMAEEAF